MLARLCLCTVVGCNEVPLCSDMEPGRKNRLKMMSSSKSFLALSFHLMLAGSCSPPPLLEMPRIYLAGRTDAIFMTLLLFYHGNSLESIYQSAAAISHVALKDQVQVIPSLHSGALRWKGRRKKTPPTPPSPPPSPPTSTHPSLPGSSNSLANMLSPV